MKNHLYLSLLLLFTGYSCYAQKMPDYGIHEIHISDTGKNIRAEIIPVTSMPAVKPNLLYYWYSSNAIHTLQGGFSGQLLNGTYNEYYLNKNLKTQGFFEKGLKNGVWKDWNVNGKLIRLITWDEGTQSGKFILFAADGRQIQSGSYDHNVLNGQVVFNEGTDSVKTVNYRNGRVIPPAKSFFKRIRIFKKNADGPFKPAAQ